MAGGVVAAGVDAPDEHADRANAPARASVRAAVIFFVLLWPFARWVAKLERDMIMRQR
jgi:hypothetical protein